MPIDPSRVCGYTRGMLADLARPHPGLQSLRPALFAEASLLSSRGAA
jgi:hypothetical protein